MRIRIRGPAATSTITLQDDATIGDLCSKVTELTSLIIFDLKFGFPPKPLEILQLPATFKLSETGVNLNGEQLIVAPKDLPGVQFSSSLSSSSSSSSPAAAKSSTPGQSQQSSQRTTQPLPVSQNTGDQLLALSRKTNTVESDPPEIPMVHKHGKMVLRVMPDDNSCLFRALGTCLLGDSIDAMTELRAIVADEIQKQPDVYDEVVLQRRPDEYCRWIQHPDNWGGFIEIKAIAEHFKTEVCSIDVQSLRVDRFAEGSGRRCIIVYSGIHYDAVAFVPDWASGSGDEDRKQFEVTEDEYLAAAMEMGRLLKERKYFTDTAGFSIVCGVCGWRGKGEREAQQHAETTGHMDFTEGE